MFSLKLICLAAFLKMGIADAIYQNRNLNNLSQINKAKREAGERSKTSLSGEVLQIYKIMLQHSDEYKYVKEGFKSHQITRRSGLRSGRRSKYKHMMNKRIRKNLQQ